MAFAPEPTGWITGIAYRTTGQTVAANSLVIPLSSLPLLVSTEITGASADIRKVYLAMADALYNAYNAKASADQPSQMQATRSTSERSGNLSRTYSFVFTATITGLEVANEPT
jgi:hypothetical protein